VYYFCQVFDIAVNLGNYASNFHQSSLPALHVTITSCNAAQAILHPSVLETISYFRFYFQEQSPTDFSSVAHFTDLNGMEAPVELRPSAQPCMTH